MEKCWRARRLRNLILKPAKLPALHNILKMLIAKNKQGQKIGHYDTKIPEELLCPHCEGELSYVKHHYRQETYVIPHFRHKIECPYETEPESQEHIIMKQEMRRILKPYFKYLEFEQRIGNRIADLEGMTYKNEKIVIECQASNISEEEIEQRTKDYTKEDYYTLWVFSHKNFLKLADNLNQPWNESRPTIYSIKPIERLIHKLNYGRAYYLITREGRYANIVNINFKSVGRNIHSEFFGTYFKYYNKRYKQINTGIMPKELGLLCFYNEGLKLARFYDKKFW